MQSELSPSPVVPILKIEIVHAEVILQHSAGIDDNYVNVHLKKHDGKKALWKTSSNMQVIKVRVMTRKERPGIQ